VHPVLTCVLLHNLSPAADSMQKGARKLGSKMGLRRGSKDREGRRSAQDGSDASTPAE
jgi:hypothetical protein